jgi:aspartyl-tRNA(Asn)/glutamyl-tRNA(Gln) amidotransferase subunit A
MNMDRREFVASSAAALLSAGVADAASSQQFAKSDLTWLPGWQIRDAIVSGKITAQAVTDHFLSRIALLDPQLHAFRAIDVSGAQEQARRADEALARGEKPGLLHGVPIAVKEVVAVKGMPSPNQGHRPGDVATIDLSPAPEDSITAERLRKAGAIILGVTIMPGMGIAPGMPDLAHHPRNPWNPETVPGSSSAGSAAAVASAMVPVAIGTDGGGSTRLPSALCGVIGLHPTIGRVPSANYTSPTLSLTITQGPITRDVRDAAIIMEVIAGPDGRDMLSTVHPPAPTYTHLAGGAAGLKLGWTEDFGFAKKYFVPETPAIIARAHQAAFAFEQLGARVETPDIVLEDFWPYVAQTMGQYEGHPQSAEVMRAAMQVRGRNRAKFDALLDRYHFILSATAVYTAPTVEQWNADWKDQNYPPFYTAETFMFNWLQLPAISLPIGFLNGMPIGLQIVGRPDSEPRMLAAAAEFLTKFPQTLRPMVS